MKNLIICMCLSTLIVSCTMRPTQEQYDQLAAQKEALQNEVAHLRDSLKLYSFPADQRLYQINKMVADGDYSGARKQIQSLQRVFPNSVEADKCPNILLDIEKKEAIAKAEQERIKALGFKAITPKSFFSIDYNTINVSNIALGQNYIIDRYDDKYHYFTADRGYKYITATMSVKSTDSNPNLPQPAIYKINGDRMERIALFAVRFYQWKDYGTYLGNYSDFNNDFSKVSKINFSIGVQISNEVLSGAYAIICKNSNELYREYERFDNPPISYVGTTNYPYNLSIESFNSDQYTLIKLYNLK